MLAAQVKEIKIDYTDCVEKAPALDKGFDDMPANNVKSSFTGSNSTINAQWALEANVSTKLFSYRVQYRPLHIFATGMLESCLLLPFLAVSSDASVFTA